MNIAFTFRDVRGDRSELAWRRRLSKRNARWVGPEAEKRYYNTAGVDTEAVIDGTRRAGKHAGFAPLQTIYPLDLQGG